MYKQKLSWMGCVKIKGEEYRFALVSWGLLPTIQ